MSRFYNTPQTLVKTVASTTVPERIASDHFPVTNAIIYGRKAVRTNNVADVWIGPESADGQQVGQIVPGGVFTVTEIDLYDVYLDVENANDGVVILYW